MTLLGYFDKGGYWVKGKLTAEGEFVAYRWRGRESGRWHPFARPINLDITAVQPGLPFEEAEQA